MESKIKASYNITKTVLEEFDKIAKEKAINKSGLVEILLTEWINKNKK